MKTRRIALRPVVVSDLPKLFEWRNSDDYRNLVHYDDSSISYLEFEKEFEKDSRQRRHQYVIVRISDGEPIGIIFCHTYSTKNGFCYLNIFIDKNCKKRGFGVDALSLVCCSLFEDVTFYKVYLEAFEYNSFSLQNIRHFGFAEEGIFKGHKMLNGTRYDVIRFALYREDLGLLRKIKNHFSKESP
ncbi:MAG TPA: GNAT family protein [Candidatus Paceibacterota bacterium]|nr:GNAT family protein [Candidatus Paceibacterota bacterium]